MASFHSALGLISACLIGISSNPAAAESSILYLALQSTGILTLSFDPSQDASNSLTIIETQADAGFRPQGVTEYEGNIYTISR